MEIIERISFYWENEWITVNRASESTTIEIKIDKYRIFHEIYGLGTNKCRHLSDTIFSRIYHREAHPREKFVTVR